MKKINLTFLCLLFAFGATAEERHAQYQADSLAFVQAPWKVTELEKGATAMYAQFEMFNSMQSISVVKYPLKKFQTEILHRPAETSGTPSSIGKELGASFVINAGYFHVDKMIPSVHFRKGKEILGYTNPPELYRVNGLVGFKDKKGRKPMIADAPDSLMYAKVSKGWHSSMASGPMLVVDGDMVVPVLMGDRADGANIAAMKEEQKTGSKHTTHYSSAAFYDRRHPRAIYGFDDEGYGYLIVIDGRFKGQGEGASIYECAFICKMLGITQAINLDGGGSSAVWTKQTGVINHPRDNRKFDHEGERVVPNLIVVY